MSDATSESDIYKIESFEELEEAKEQVLSNYMCKCCKIEFCKDCLKEKAKLTMCSKSIPLEIIENISSNIRCSKCQGMIEAIEKQYTQEKYMKDHRCPLDLFTVKAYYYKKLNEFPPYNCMEQNLFCSGNFKEENRWDGFAHNCLEKLYDGIDDYEKIYNWMDRILEKHKDEDDPFKELNTLFNSFMEILNYIDRNEHYNNNILYGEGFGLDIADELNDIFFSVSDSESEYDED